ncbi:hypothetical protein MH076_03785 [Bacillus altitudinis]|nr:hypothetical protein [Bacillus altitudinis]
MPVEGKTKCE